MRPAGIRVARVITMLKPLSRARGTLSGCCAANLQTPGELRSVHAVNPKAYWITEDVSGDSQTTLWSGILALTMTLAAFKDLDALLHEATAAQPACTRLGGRARRLSPRTRRRSLLLLRCTGFLVISLWECARPRAH